MSSEELFSFIVQDPYMETVFVMFTLFTITYGVKLIY